jgi:glutamate N-acetyltransferase/amino-acid N-acetyltransferase
VFTNSTGVIGVPLDMPRIRAGIQAAVAALAPDGGLDAAVAIMTTDTRPKHIAVQVDVGGRMVTIGGMAKGAGMIHPNMATMLAYVTTDAALAPELLQAATKRAADLSFNVITVDGDTSTSDTCLVLANSTAGNPRWESAADPGYAAFEAAFQYVFQHLAREIARDGEGATKLLTVTVRGALTEAEARQIARTVAGSNLFKAAVFGCDPNWGRIAAAAGRAGAVFDPRRLDVTMNGIPLLRSGEPLPFDRAAAIAGLKEATEVTVEVGLNAGDASATAWGCDLTVDYVKINAEYFT